MTSKPRQKLVGVVTLSPKGQIVVPRDARRELGLAPGEKIAVIKRDTEVLLKKVSAISVVEIAERAEVAAKKKGIDLDKLIAEAIEWARSKE